MSVIEVRGRGGQLLERIRRHGPVISVGRAYDNDVILEDRYVSPHHLRLIRSGNGWRIQDLGSLNAYRHRAVGTAESGADLLRSGDSLRIGHSVLHVFDERHDVPATLRLGGMEARIAALGNHNVWPVIISLTIAATLLQYYWSSFSEFKPVLAVQLLYRGVVGAFIIAAFWALVGRLVRHRAYFYAHFSIWSLMFLVGEAFTILVHWIAYNANSAVLEEGLESALLVCLLTLTVWASLLLATNLHARSRLATALAVMLAITSIDLLAVFHVDRRFSAVPDYYGRITQPALLLAHPASEDRLPDRLPALFDAADREAERLEREARERG